MGRKGLGNANGATDCFVWPRSHGCTWSCLCAVTLHYRKITWRLWKKLLYHIHHTFCAAAFVSMSYEHQKFPQRCWHVRWLCKKKKKKIDTSTLGFWRKYNHTCVFYEVLDHMSTCSCLFIAHCIRLTVSLKVKNPHTYLWIVHADLLALSSSTMLLLWKAVLWLFMCLAMHLQAMYVLICWTSSSFSATSCH